jgi:hypothetical protein
MYLGELALSLMDHNYQVRAFEQAASQSLKRGSKVDFIY